MRSRIIWVWTLIFRLNETISTSMSPGKRLLTVCTGNTCRSPMLMALIFIEGEVLKNSIQLFVESAGIGERARLRLPASKHSRTLFPGVLDHHRSSHIRDKVLISYDRVLSMTESHRETCISQCIRELEGLNSHPMSEAARNQTSAPRLGHPNGTHSRRHMCEERIVLGPLGEVEDPFNGTLETYRACAARLRGWARCIVAEMAAEEAGPSLPPAGPSQARAAPGRAGPGPCEPGRIDEHPNEV